MSSKKSSKPLKKARPKTSRNGKPHQSRIWHDDNVGLMLDTEYEVGFEVDYSDTPRPFQLNPETSEEREKRLAARKAKTLKAFQAAYENRHRRKAS